MPVADETGWFTHWVSVQRDVTGRKQAEEVAVRARIAEIENRALEAEIAQRKRTEERLVHAAFHDDLTRLRNRAYLMDRLADRLALPWRTPPLAPCCSWTSTASSWSTTAWATVQVTCC